MIVRKSSLKLFVLWLVGVALLSGNIAVHQADKSGQDRYAQALDTLYSTQNERRGELQRLAGQAQIRHDQATELSEQGKALAQALNNGENVEQKAARSNDCAPYQKPWRQFTDLHSCGFTLVNAVGDLKLLVVPFVGPNLDVNQADNKKFIEAFLSDSPIVAYNVSPAYPNGQTSISYLKTFFESEANRFHVDFSLSVTKLTPIRLSEPPPAAPNRSDVGKNREFFLEEFRKAKIDIRDYDSIAIIMFNPHGQDNFTSYGLPAIRASINSVNINPWSTGYSVSIVAHETAHTLGTSDQYILMGSGCQPGTNDDYLMTTHNSLMCYTGEINLTYSNSSVINGRAAREMGWLQ